MRDRDDYFSRPKQSADALTIFLSVLAAIIAAWALNVKPINTDNMSKVLYIHPQPNKLLNEKD